MADKGDLADADRPRWADGRHFYAAAAQAMQRILVDNARRRRSIKRGGGQAPQSIEGWEPAWPEPREDLIALDEALTRLATVDPQAAELVRLRFFLGYPLLNVAEILGLSPRTAYRLWAYARAWLHQEISVP